MVKELIKRFCVFLSAWVCKIAKSRDSSISKGSVLRVNFQSLYSFILSQGHVRVKILPLCFTFTSFE